MSTPFLLKLFFVIALMQLFTLKDTFSLALFGDDWFTLTRYFLYVGPYASGEYNHLSYFLTMYGSQDSFFALLYHLFGLQSQFYYGVSFLLRLLAAVSVYPLLFGLTKNRLAGFIAALFFAVSFIGIETTNWVFNLPSYLAIIFLNIFFCVYLSRGNISIKKGLLITTLFVVTFVVQPIRMTGLPLMILLIEAFVFFHNKTKLRQLFYVSFALVGFLLVKLVGNTISKSDEMVQRALAGLEIIIKKLQAGELEILMNPFITLGSLFIPDILWNQFTTILSTNFFWIFVVSLLGFVIIVFLLTKSSSLSNNFLIISGAFGILWTLFVRYISVYNAPAFSDPFKTGSALIGGYFIITILTLLYHLWRDKQAFPLFLSLVIIISSFIVPWLFTPEGHFSTSHRYLILTSLGLAIFWGTISTLMRQNSFSFLFFLVISIAFILQIQANHIFFKQLTISRSIEVSDTIWSQLGSLLPDVKNAPSPLIVYFEGDGINGDTLYQVITFGFPPHISLLYDIPHDDKRLPVPISDFKELTAIYQTGQPLSAYAHQQKPVPLEQIYAFKLEGRTKILDITQQTRKQLQQSDKN